MSVKKVVSQFLIILLFTSLYWLPAKAQSEAETIIQGWVDAAEQYDFLEVSHKGINYDDTTDIAIVNDLKISFFLDSVHVKFQANEFNYDTSKQPENGSDKPASPPKITYTFLFPTIELKDLSFDGSHYSAESILARTAQINFDISETAQSNSNGSGEYRNMVFHNIRWATLPEFKYDPEKPVSSYFPIVQALLDMSFDSASIDSVTTVQNMETPKARLRTTYGKMEIGKAVRGNFSSVNMGEMRIQSEPIDSDNSSSSAALPFLDMVMESATATDYNYRTFLEMFLPENIVATDTNEYQPVTSHMAINNLKIESNQASFKIGQILAKDFGIKAPTVNVLDQLDVLIKDAMQGKQPEDPKETIRLIGSIYGLFRFGEMNMSGMEFTAPNQVKGKLNSFRIADLSSEGLGEYSISGISFFDGKSSSFDMGNFTLSDIKFPSLEALINLEQASKSNNISEILKAIPTMAKASLQGLLVNIEGVGEVSVDETSLSMADFIGPIPSNIQLLAKNAKIPTSIMDRKPRQMFTALGYQEVDVSYDIRLKWEELSQLVSVDAEAALVDGGDLSFNFDIGGIPKSIFENPQTVQSAVAFATLGNAEIEFSDNSLVDKGLRLAGAARGVNADTMKAQIVGMIPVMLQRLEKPGFVDQLTATVQSFLDTKGTIRASATPEAPVLIIQLMGAGAAAPGAVIDLLKLNVEATQ